MSLDSSGAGPTGAGTNGGTARPPIDLSVQPAPEPVSFFLNAAVQVPCQFGSGQGQKTRNACGCNNSNPGPMPPPPPPSTPPKPKPEPPKGE